MSKKLGIEVIGVNEPREAMFKSDVAVTSGPILKNPRPTIDGGWLQPGGFANAADFSYWKPEAFTQFDEISTDDHAQFQYYRSISIYVQHPTPTRTWGR